MFRNQDSPKASSLKSLNVNDMDLDEDPGAATNLTKYNLRAGPREAEKRLPLTWVDQDQSGDYDPKTARVNLSTASKKKKPLPTNSLENIIQDEPRNVNMISRGEAKEATRAVKQASKNDNIAPKRLATLKTITTSLAHPIIFNYQPQTDTEPPHCHWCDRATYGLVGLGEVRVEVIDHRDGQGYIELDGGHTAAGHPPSRMCMNCTTKRLLICACPKHELGPLRCSDSNPTDVDSSLFIEQDPIDADRPHFEWCSVCLAPASSACCTATDFGGITHLHLTGRTSGCGLQLCTRCAQSLEFDGHSELGALIDYVKAGQENRTVGLRADVDFLHPNGDLLKWFRGG